MVLEQQRTGLWSHLLALVELTKPKIALLELMTVLVAASVASSGIPDKLILVINALVGTALVAASASALNQWLERDLDAGMHRTKDRPLPSGQLTDREAFWFGAVTMGSGTLYLIFSGESHDGFDWRCHLVSLCLRLHTSKNPQQRKYAGWCNRRCGSCVDGMGECRVGMGYT